jgi:hypothetical protein
LIFNNLNKEASAGLLWLMIGTYDGCLWMR